ncbi:MAG: anaerobic ribonucleoside-triphosphate reductase activating protein [Ruminococcus sp.]|nr:anaerobic ribonucleoside-triphosphate reductase activating protein [Ruminococcus sp.]
MKLKLAGLENDSIVDGPGIRFTVFVQGCPHHCEGCHNPQTWDFSGGYFEDTEEIYQKILKNPLLDGVTFSGGEPFCQCHELADLADKIISGTRLDLMAYTGFEIEYLIEHSTEENGFMRLLEKLDFLVDGRFILSQKSYDLKFKGSANQRFIDVKKTLKDSEVVLAVDPWDNLEIKLI